VIKSTYKFIKNENRHFVENVADNSMDMLEQPSGAQGIDYLKNMQQKERAIA